MKTFFIENWYNLITSVVAVLGIFGTVYQYFDKKKWEHRWKEFEVYHTLIKKFTNFEGRISLNEQIAIAYELEFFKRYHKITLRILQYQKKRWEEKHGENNTGLFEALDLVIEDLNKKTKLWRKILPCC